MAHLNEHKLLSDKQHALSCETQLTTGLDAWVIVLDNHGQVDTFMLDSEKAFDTTPHELLIMFCFNSAFLTSNYLFNLQISTLLFTGFVQKNFCTQIEIFLCLNILV